METMGTAYRYSGDEEEESEVDEVEWVIEPVEAAVTGCERGLRTVRSEHSDSASLTSEDSVRFDLNTLASLRVDKRPFPSMIPLFTPLSTLEERSEASTASTTGTSARSSIHRPSLNLGSLHGSLIRPQADDAPTATSLSQPNTRCSLQAAPITDTSYKDFSEFWGRTEIHPQKSPIQPALNRIGPVEVAKPKQASIYSVLAEFTAEHHQNEQHTISAPPRDSTASVETLVIQDYQSNTVESNIHRVAFDSKPPTISRKTGTVPARTSISKPNISSPLRSNVYLQDENMSAPSATAQTTLAKFLPFNNISGKKVEARTSISTFGSSVSTMVASAASLDVYAQRNDETLVHPTATKPVIYTEQGNAKGVKRFLERAALFFKIRAKRKESNVSSPSAIGPHSTPQKSNTYNSISTITRPPSFTVDDFATSFAYDHAKHCITPSITRTMGKPPTFHQQQQKQHPRSSAISILSQHCDDTLIGAAPSLPRSFASSTSCEAPHFPRSPLSSLQQSHNNSANHSCDSLVSLGPPRCNSAVPNVNSNSRSPSFGSAISTLHRPLTEVIKTVYEDNYLVRGSTMANLDRNRLAFCSAAWRRRRAEESNVRSLREGANGDGGAFQAALEASMAILSSDSGKGSSCVVTSVAERGCGSDSGIVPWSKSEFGSETDEIPLTPHYTFIWREEKDTEAPPMVRRSRSSPAVVISIGGVEDMKVAVGVELAKLYYDVCISELGVHEIAERVEAGEYVEHDASSQSS
ncbi:hypothetical protein BC830DRAFT_1165185 [Chytriomyces sp. MP71]|nr:hypothetical protein BC830DRAFT_1165185 [Chytriomyces sp. MP71]